jgi:hypothetical protein
VASFLFQIRRGYCTYYSSALAVMLRALGIPTRWVVGFRVPAPAPGATAVVTDAQAHAWVEAFVPPYGWQILDPTPPGPTLRAQAPAAASAPPPPQAAPQAQAAARKVPGGAPGGGGSPTRAWLSAALGLAGEAGRAAPRAMAALLAAAALALALLAWRERRIAATDPVRAAHRLWRSIERRAGRLRSPATTPRELGARLAELRPDRAEVLARLAEAYGRVCYGPPEGRSPAADEMRAAWRELGAARIAGWMRPLRRPAATNRPGGG